MIGPAPAAARGRTRAVWLLAVAVGVALAGCRRTPRSGARAETPVPLARSDGGPPRWDDVAQPAPVDAAVAAALSPEDRALAALVLADAREVAPGRFDVPLAAHRLFMRAHIALAAALGTLEAPLPGGTALRLHLGPSPVLAALGLREGDRLLVIGGRRVANMRPQVDEALLRVLLMLGDGALDLDVDRGGTRLHLHYRVR